MSNKILMIIAQDDFRDEEYFETKGVLELYGFAVLTASITRDNCRSMFNETVEPDLSVIEADAEDYAAVVLVGGKGALSLLKSEDVERVVREAYDKLLVVSAICIAPVILAKYGLLRGRRATVYENDVSRDAFIQAGVQFIEQDVVVDGKIVTANGPKAADKFGKAIVDVLKPGQI